MADKTGIEWTEATWNPVVGCSKVSPGCDHCYAETLALRHGWTPKPWTLPNASENVTLKPERLDQPLKWKRPRMVFVNSMSDLFHENVGFDYILKVFLTMRDAERHTFQVLTKRPRRAAQFLSLHEPMYGVAPNVWLGVSIESWRFNWRADVLREIPAAVRFISAEPLLDTLYPIRTPDRQLSLDGIDWLIVGGESGAGARPMEPLWALELRDAAAENGTAFFFKQWGGRTPKSGGKVLDGREWCDMPRKAAA
jgi:protein gp37